MTSVDTGSGSKPFPSILHTRGYSTPIGSWGRGDGEDQGEHRVLGSAGGRARFERGDDEADDRPPFRRCRRLEGRQRSNSQAGNHGSCSDCTQCPGSWLVSVTLFTCIIHTYMCVRTLSRLFCPVHQLGCSVLREKLWRWGQGRILDTPRFTCDDSRVGKGAGPVVSMRAVRFDAKSDANEGHALMRILSTSVVRAKESTWGGARSDSDYGTEKNIIAVINLCCNGSRKM